MALAGDLPKILSSTEVLILDDAFDEVPELRDLSTQVIQEFATSLEDSEEALEQLSGVVGGQILPQNVQGALTDAHVAALWARRDGGDALAAALLTLFSAFITRRQVQLEQVVAVEKILTNDLKLTVTRRGRKDRDSLPNTAKVWFIDYYLIEDAGEADLRSHVESVRRQWESIQVGKRPLLILMSSRPVDIARQREFREQANVLAAQFRFEPKAKLREALHLQLVLGELVDQYVVASQIDKILETWQEILVSCAKDFTSKIRCLDVADYQSLRQLRLESDGVTLGAYLMWVYTQHYLSLVERHDRTGALVKELSAIDFEKPPTVTLLPSYQLTRIYDSLVFSSLRSDWTSIKEEGLKNEEGMFVISLGDVLLRDEKVEVPDTKEESRVEASAAAEATPQPADSQARPTAAAEEEAPAADVEDAVITVPYLVVNPACDLVRRPPNAKVILVRGRFENKADLAWPVDPEDHELIVIDEEERVVTWQHKDLHTIPYKELSAGLESGAWRCVARMRSLYALKQQRSMMAELIRVGTEVPPHEYRNFGCDVFFRTTKREPEKVVTLGAAETAVATGGRKGQGHQLFFLPRAIEALRELAAKDGVQAETKSVFEDLEALRALRGPINLKDLKAGTGAAIAGDRIIVKIVSTAKRDDAHPRQIDGKTRVFINLVADS